jgi:hypothetical protein
MAVTPNDPAATIEDFGPCPDLRNDRRLGNIATYELARRYGAADYDVLQFMCECGRPECRLLVTRAVLEFDPDSAPGSVIAYH